MTRPVGREAYRTQLAALLPRGRVWPTGTTSVLARLLGALAASLARLDAAAAALLPESRPSTAYFLLGEWENEFGLPDPCSDPAQTIEGRRAAVIGKMLDADASAPLDIVAFALRWGVVVTVREAASEADASALGYDATDGRWRFVWWVDIGTLANVREFTTASDVNTPLRAADAGFGTELACRLRELAPAHTLMLTTFVGAENVLTFRGKVLTFRGSILTFR